MSATTGSFSIGESAVQMPVKTGTLGPSVVDIGKLYAQTGMFTCDPGFTTTTSCVSEITYIDGEEGVLLYRGYSIEQIAEHGDFLETCYLLFYGQLPNAVQKKAFDHRVTRHTMVHEQMARFFQGLRRDSHPMAVLVASVGALSAFYHDSTDISDPHQRISIMPRISCTCASRCPARIIKSIRSLPARSIVSSFSMLITSRIRRPRWCGLLAPPAQIRLRA